MPLCNHSKVTILKLKKVGSLLPIGMQLENKHDKIEPTYCLAMSREMLRYLLVTRSIVLSFILIDF